MSTYFIQKGTTAPAQRGKDSQCVKGSRHWSNSSRAGNSNQSTVHTSALFFLLISNRSIKMAALLSTYSAVWCGLVQPHARSFVWPKGTRVKLSCSRPSTHVSILILQSNVNRVILQLAFLGVLFRCRSSRMDIVISRIMHLNTVDFSIKTESVYIYIYILGQISKWNPKALAEIHIVFLLSVTPLLNFSCSQGI